MGVLVNGFYTRNSSYDDTVVTVSRPLSSSFITGGGYLVNTGAAGLVGHDTGQKTNFGYNVKYNKSGTNLQGHANIIVRGAGGRTYQIKSTAISSLAVQGSKANFSSKASIQDITDPLNPISLDGNATLQMAITDNADPGSADTLAITVLNKSGGTWFSSRWDGTKTLEQILGGGNLVVR